MRDKKGGKRYPYLWAVLYGTILTGYAVFTLLDAFVLPRDIVYLKDIADRSSVNGTTSGQEAPRQDMVEPAKTEDSSKTEAPPKSEEQAKPEDLSKPEEQAKPEEMSKPKEQSNPEDPSKPEEQSNPEDSSKPEDPSKPEDSSKPKAPPQSEDPPTPKEFSEPVVTDTSYESAEISITITTQRQYDTEIYIADVIIKDISYLRAGLAGSAFGRNIKETTSKMAEDNEAILAINGDYYGFRDSGFVMRNGYLYRDTARAAGNDDALAVYEDGHMEIVSENDADVQALTQDVIHIFSFGPGLIQEGDILVNEYSEVEQSMRSNPRTAIGEISPLHYLFVVSDGRTEESEGLSLWQLAQIMQELGCETAYNLDGGGSSTMWFMGRTVNNPTSGRRIGERSVSDIVYIGE